MSDIEKQVTERFAADVAQHVMTVEMDNGVHRCLYFGRRGSGVYSFRVVTWPGHLYIGGDCDDFVFSRLTDMFEFFRTDSGRVNLSYWSEKLQAIARHAGHRKFDADTFRATIFAAYKAWRQWDDVDRFTLEERIELRERVREVMSAADESEHDAYRAAYEFSFDGDSPFADLGSCEQYTYGFVWACHAIVWAIAQYDAVKAAAVEVPAHA